CSSQDPLQPTYTLDTEAIGIHYRTPTTKTMRLTGVLFIRKVLSFAEVDPWYKTNQWMKFAFKYRGRSARCPKLGIHRVYKALQYVRTLRDVHKADARSIWNTRIAIASEQCGLCDPEVLLEGLSQTNILLNRNMLQTLAIYEPRTFAALVDIAKQYHIERNVPIDSAPDSQVVSRGMLHTPIVPGNKHLY
ncbi:unnamed protein product, partial [Dicrocoelium dendriticum]